MKIDKYIYITDIPARQIAGGISVFHFITRS